jgi:hypothetical protein
MNLARLLVVIGSILLLAGGYLASQLAAMNGQAADYATKIDQPSIRAFAALLLVAAVALSLVRDREEGRG